MTGSLTATALAPLPEIRAGDDLAALITAAYDEPRFAPGDIVVISHKVVSKAEGRTVDLSGVVASARARELAVALGRDDPRVVQVVLTESAELIRTERSTIIARTHHGFVCANAGVDRSNAGDGERCVLLPADPDRSARTLRAALPGRPAIVIADSFGRAWRIGECDIAIGVAGLRPLDDRRGDADRDGRPLSVSQIAIADQVAAAADLARGGKASGRPAVLVRGLERYVSTDDGPGVSALLRDRNEDLFGAT